MTTATPTTIEELDDPSSVLVFARARRADADRAEADVLGAAVIWAEQHPPESIDQAATWISVAGTPASRWPDPVHRWSRSSPSPSSRSRSAGPPTPVVR